MVPFFWGLAPNTPGWTSGHFPWFRKFLSAPRAGFSFGGLPGHAFRTRLLLWWNEEVLGASLPLSASGGRGKNGQHCPFVFLGNYAMLSISCLRCSHYTDGPMPFLTGTID